MEKKIVFCGGGPMGEGILEGLLRNGVAVPEQITVNELLPARRDYLTNTYQVSAVLDATEALKEADLVIIAVNPAQISGVAKNVRPLAKPGAVLMSIACGVKLAELEEELGEEKKIIRVMPNTLIKSGNGYSGVCVNANIDDQDKIMITEVLNALGQTMYVKEDMFETFTAVCCVGPLWFYKTVEALIDAGVHAGFSRTDSRAMVIKNMLGVAQVLDESGIHPALRVDDMTSPGGATIEALKVLHDEGFAGALMKSVAATVYKAKNLH